MPTIKLKYTLVLPKLPFLFLGEGWGEVNQTLSGIKNPVNPLILKILIQTKKALILSTTYACSAVVMPGKSGRLRLVFANSSVIGKLPGVYLR